MKKITYTKNDIIRRITSDTNISIDESRVMVDTVLDTFKQYFQKPDKNFRIEIRNFGVIESKPAKAKPKARNPRTNEEIFVPAHKKTHFKPGKLIKEHLKKPI